MPSPIPSVANGDDTETELPWKWAICGTCRGNGAHSLHLGAITQSDRDRDWDEESWNDYMAGRYDRECGDCEDGKVRVVDRSRCSPELLARWDQSVREAEEDDAERRAEMRACYGWDSTGMDYRY